MKIKAVKDFRGSLNGYEVITIEKGVVINVDEETARIFIEAGFCELETPKQKTNAN